MYNIYTAHAYIHYVYILCNIRKYELIARGKHDQTHIFSLEGRGEIPMGYACKEKEGREKVKERKMKKNDSAINPWQHPCETLIRIICNKK